MILLLSLDSLLMAFVYAAGGDNAKFLELSNSMIDIYKDYAMIGYEGITFGNMMKVFSADKELVKTD